MNSAWDSSAESFPAKLFFNTLRSSVIHVHCSETSHTLADFTEMMSDVQTKVVEILS